MGEGRACGKCAKTRTIVACPSRTISWNLTAGGFDASTGEGDELWDDGEDEEETDLF